MVAIETEDGRFEAADMKAAQRLARAAARKSKKTAEQATDDREQAGLRAAYQAYRLHEWLTDCRRGDRISIPRGIRLFEPSDSYSPVQLTREYNSLGAASDRAVYETRSGPITFEHYGMRVVAALADGGGCAIAVLLRSSDGRAADVELCAIGAHNGKLSLQPVNIPAGELRSYLATERNAT